MGGAIHEPPPLPGPAPTNHYVGGTGYATRSGLPQTGRLSSPTPRQAP